MVLFIWFSRDTEFRKVKNTFESCENVPFNLVVLKMLFVKLELKRYQNGIEAFYMKWTKKKSKTNKLKNGEYTFIYPHWQVECYQD